MMKEKAAEMLGWQVGQVFVLGPPPLPLPWWLRFVVVPLSGLAIDEALKWANANDGEEAGTAGSEVGE